MKTEENPIFDWIADNDKKPLPKELLDEFKSLCAYQLVHSPDHTLKESFELLLETECITYGQAATIAPFMVDAQNNL